MADSRASRAVGGRMERADDRPGLLISPWRARVRDTLRTTDDPEVRAFLDQRSPTMQAVGS